MPWQSHAIYYCCLFQKPSINTIRISFATTMWPTTMARAYPAFFTGSFHCLHKFESDIIPCSMKCIRRIESTMLHIHLLILCVAHPHIPSMLPLHKPITHDIFQLINRSHRRDRILWQESPANACHPIKPTNCANCLRYGCTNKVPTSPVLPSKQTPQQRVLRGRRMVHLLTEQSSFVRAFYGKAKWNCRIKKIINE